MTRLFVYRLRNYGDLEPIVEELSAVYDKKTLLQIYHEAVGEPYSFFYVNFIQKIYTKCLWPDWIITEIQVTNFTLLCYI